MRREMYKFKAVIIITLINLLIIPSVFAQTPDKISYQSVIRNSSDQLITDQAIGMKISILQNSESGTPVYVETQAPISNANGLVSIKIGSGTLVTGVFADIDWANDTYFIKTEIDIAGGTNYTITGTSQLLSVPYALHAKTAESLTGTYFDQFINIFENNGMTVVDFSVPYTHVLMGNEFGFTDLSAINANTWHWDFGDGNTSTVQNPTHTYQTEGVFTVSLTAGNGTLSVTKTKSDYMTVTDGPVYDSFTDVRDGTVYQSVTIGDQVWMAENLKFLEYVYPPDQYNIIFPFFYVYGYSGSDVAEAKATVNYNTYGVLYNRAAATSYSLCPSGWHLPTDAEWNQLANYFVDIATEGGKLKEAGTTHWNSPNTGATNETGFTALPGGQRDESSTFGNLKQVGHWWSATEDDPEYENYGLTWELRYDSSSLERSAHFYSVGLSVRCVRD
ncbi:MAG: FISUMP domain-containing protein [Bacteroidales bacterium]|nr:FISUMP domain-containing protein [Bacteroidales bacterium]